MLGGMLPGEGVLSLGLPAQAPGVGSQDREAPLRCPEQPPLPGAGAWSVRMGDHAGTWPISQPSYLWTLPSLFLSTHGPRTDPSTRASAKRTPGRALWRGQWPVTSNKRRNRGSRTRAAAAVWTNLSVCNPGGRTVRLPVFIRYTGVRTSPRPGWWPAAHIPTNVLTACGRGGPKERSSKYSSSFCSPLAPPPPQRSTMRQILLIQRLWVILCNRWTTYLHASVLHVLNTYLTDGCRASWETHGLKNNAQDWGEGESPRGFHQSLTQKLGAIPWVYFCIRLFRAFPTRRRTTLFFKPCVQIKSS